MLLYSTLDMHRSTLHTARTVSVHVWYPSIATARPPVTTWRTDETVVYENDDWASETDTRAKADGCEIGTVVDAGGNTYFQIP